ncbi:flavodoxin family protein [Christensenellaceae bacterium NSJ-44]|uniref:Flavodoxin family protein n=1 Tax=Luoshenia tenuis TaxID=2763654 RepID=A0A926CYL9_9FIRM|nr:flavodoxin family protein [Luoshenia tenuis]MBC8528102.1 flavodoxin family protein [Luoshenia tenuis]
MKVLLINGSPRKNGCTFTALSEVAGEIEKAGIETEIFHIGAKAIWGCTDCGGCEQTDRCVHRDDGVNAILDRQGEIDGLIVGAPVHYASAAGAITAFMDRLFYAGGAGFAHKPGAAVATCRRAGSTATLDQLNKYFTISQMPLVSSQYWNMVHGNTPDEVRQDLEGMQIMRTLGRNMAWLLRCIEVGKAAGIPYPEGEPRAWTNFIR